jgi:hypothetical protein
MAKEITKENEEIKEEVKEEPKGETKTIEKLEAELAHIKKSQSGSDLKVAELEKVIKSERAEKEKLLKEKMSAEDAAKYELEQNRLANEQLKNELKQKELRFKIVDKLAEEGLSQDFKDLVNVDDEEQITEKINLIKKIIDNVKKRTAENIYKTDVKDNKEGNKQVKPDYNPFAKFPSH